MPYVHKVSHGIKKVAARQGVSWLSDEDHPLLPELTARVAAATGLAVDSAEPFQVVNYGLGGYYALHLDAIEFDGAGTLGVERISGNRLATMLVFLSDVPSGGATAFAEPALAAKPRAGDALFWFDLRPYAALHIGR
ncbi:prolyl 4-hydroxylase subunit alpha-2-like [Amblyomma americanum]